MGKKHAKKRFFCVKYTMKPDKKFDELVTLSKKKIGYWHNINQKILIKNRMLKIDYIHKLQWKRGYY